MVESVRVLAVTSALLSRISDTKLDDLIEYHRPDVGYLITDTNAETATERMADLRERITGPCLAPSTTERFRHVTVNSVDLLTAPDPTHLDAAADLDRDTQIASEQAAFVFTPTLDVTIDTTRLAASLDPADPFYDHHRTTTTPHVYVSSALDATYTHVWDDDLHVQGLRPIESDRGIRIPCLECYADGHVKIDTLPHTKLGIRAIDGVGRKTADRLADRGYSDRASLTDTTRNELQSLPGIGQSTANTIYDHARALEQGMAIRTSDLPVPGSDPVFVSIATDGFSPSIIWQICVYNAATNSFRSFVERDPDRQGGIIQAFLSWYLAEAKNQRLIAWNGWEFAFAHLAEFIDEYAPEYVNVWENISKTDLYAWAVDQGHAMLPGRTNQLLEVSEALGYTPETTGLTSRMVATDYREWMASQAPEDELDWTRYRQYCESRVRALVYIYDHLRLDEHADNTLLADQL